MSKTKSKKVSKKLMWFVIFLIESHKGAWWMPRHKVAMKDVAWRRYTSGRCRATFDPEVSEWGNPSQFIETFFRKKKSAPREVKHLSTWRKRKQQRFREQRRAKAEKPKPCQFTNRGLQGKNVVYQESYKMFCQLKFLERNSTEGDRPVDENETSFLFLFLSTSRHEQLGGTREN